jgi:hypothetical protein
VCFASGELTVTHLCSSGRPCNRRLYHSALTSNRPPSKDWNLSLCVFLTHAQVWTILAMIVDLCRWLNKQAASWPRMLMRDMTLTLISTQFAAADPVSLRCVATIESCDCQRYATRRQVCLSVPAIDARAGSRLLLLNALQATRRDTTGLLFGRGAWRQATSST